MGHFGSRVIGHEKAAEEAVVQKAGAHHFGPRVIGDVLAARRLLERQDDGAKDSRSDPATKAAKKAASQASSDETIETIEAPVTAKLEELELALDLNPAFYDALYTSEFARTSGPRKGALRLFLRHEMDHLDGRLITDNMSSTDEIANRRALKQLEADFAESPRRRSSSRCESSS